MCPGLSACSGVERPRPLRRGQVARLPAHDATQAQSAQSDAPRATVRNQPDENKFVRSAGTDISVSIVVGGKIPHAALANVFTAPTRMIILRSALFFARSCRRMA